MQRIVQKLKQRSSRSDTRLRAGSGLSDPLRATEALCRIE